jgi:hypothetical protein
MNKRTCRHCRTTWDWVEGDHECLGSVLEDLRDLVLEAYHAGVDDGHPFTWPAERRDHESDLLDRRDRLLERLRAHVPEAPKDGTP